MVDKESFALSLGELCSILRNIVYYSILPQGLRTCMFMWTYRGQIRNYNMTFLIGVKIKVSCSHQIRLQLRTEDGKD